MPKVTMIATGGTIASLRGPDGVATPTLTTDALVAAVPQLADVADMEKIQFRQVASPDLGLADGSVKNLGQSACLSQVDQHG